MNSQTSSYDIFPIYLGEKLFVTLTFLCVKCFYGTVDSKQKSYWDNMYRNRTLEQLHPSRWVESVYRLGCPSVEMPRDSDIAPIPRAVNLCLIYTQLKF